MGSATSAPTARWKMPTLRSYRFERREKLKPFSTYPEDRQKLISLATILQKPHDIEAGQKAADELSDMVLAILRDEEVYLDDGHTAA